MINYQEDPMAAVPQQEPAKPARKRAPSTWQVFMYDEGLLRPRGQFDARNAEAACWMAAESEQMRPEATSEEGVKLVAIKANEIAPQIYRLRSTVERVKA